MKRLLVLVPLVSLIALTLGCQDQQALAEIEEMRAQTLVEEQNKEIVLRLYENTDNQNFEAVISAFAPDAPINASGRFQHIHAEDFRPIFPVWFTAFPDYTHHIQDVIAQEDKVVVRIMFSGTHEGDFFNAPPTGKPMQYLGIHIHHLKNGKIVESWVLEDMLYLWQQLEMELELAAAKEWQLKRSRRSLGFDLQSRVLAPGHRTLGNPLT